MKVPNAASAEEYTALSLSRLQNEGSQLGGAVCETQGKSIKATERRFPTTRRREAIH